MDRYARGDEQAFAIVYDAVSSRLERALRRRVKSAALVDDIVQQTFLHVHDKRGTFCAGSQVMPWAFRIAQNFMYDVLRKERREPAIDLSRDDDDSSAWLVNAVANGEQMIAARQARVRILGVFDALTEHQRAAFELTKGDGLSQVEAAQILGTTVMGVKQCVHKVYEKLRRALSEEVVSLEEPSSSKTSARLGDP